MVAERAERAAVAAIVAAACVLYLVYSVVTPLFEASDELWHYPMVHTLATGNGLPVQRKDQTDADAPWRQEGSQPPLYYAVAALITAPFDASNWRDIRRVNPHADMGVPTRDGNANAILHTPAEAFPWQRAALAVRVARWVSVAMSTATVLFVYLAARELLPGRRRAARLGATVIAAATPMFAFISGAINNDNAAVLFSTIGLWWALRLLRANDVTPRAAVVAGAITAAAALSKVSGLGMLGLFAAAAVAAPVAHGDLRRAGGPRASAVRTLVFGLVMTAIVAALAGWWFVRNQQLYGDWLGWNAFLDVVGRRDSPASLAQLWTEREGFAWAYWGVFGTLNVVYPAWVYDGLNAVAVVALAGCAFGLVRARRAAASGATASPAAVLPAQWLVALAYLGLILAGLLRWTALTPASQGRLMFPAIGVISTVLAYGLWRLDRRLVAACAAALVALSALTPFVVIAPAYARPADGWARRLPQPIGALFGGAVELVEASRPGGPVVPGDEVTLELNWRLTRPVGVNYSVFTHLVDEDEVIVAQRDMHPGQGSLPLSEVAAPYAWSDRYTLRLPPLALAPKALTWRVGVYDLRTGERLRAADGAEYAGFGSMRLERHPGSAPLLTYANGVILRAYDVQPRAARAGEAVTVNLDLSAAGLLDGDANVSLQLIDDAARKVAQQDFGLGRQPGAERRELRIAPDAPPGVYRLLLVVYQPRDGFPRIGAYDARGQFAGDQIELTRVRVR